MKTVHFSTDIPVRYSADVCVVGAGPAGVSAAVSAARQGAKVLLFDAHTMPGGMSTAGRVPTLMTYSDGVHFLPEGFGRDVFERMHSMAKALDFSWQNTTPWGFGASLNSWHVQNIYEELLTAAGVEVLYSCRLTAAITENDRIKQALFVSPGGLFATEAGVFVDATGDGTLAAWSDVPFELAAPDELMPPTLCSIWTGVDWETYHKAKVFSHDTDAMLELLDKAFETGEITEMDYHHTGMFRLSNHLVGANITHAYGVDPSDELSLSRALIRNRKNVAQYENFYRKHIKGFEKAEIIDCGSLLGVRESRRIQCDYMLTFTDYKNCQDFEDSIGRYSYPADLHPAKPDRQSLEEHKKLMRTSALPKGKSYAIPYRSLLPIGKDNLLMAGRCIGCDRLMHSSVRTIPGCWITGQSAGIAAALAVKNGCSCRSIDIKELQNRLQELHVLL